MAHDYMPSQYSGQIPTFLVPAVGVVLMTLFIVLFMYSRQTKRSARRTGAVTEDPEKVTVVPLYAINSKNKTHHNMWNIDLLDDE